METLAKGDYSLAFGTNTKSYGRGSLSFGNGSLAGRSSDSNSSDKYSTAFGWHTKATGNYSVAFGGMTEASGNDYYTLAFGERTLSEGRDSTAFVFFCLPFKPIMIRRHVLGGLVPFIVFFVGPHKNDWLTSQRGGTSYNRNFYNSRCKQFMWSLKTKTKPQTSPFLRKGSSMTSSSAKI